MLSGYTDTNPVVCGGRPLSVMEETLVGTLKKPDKRDAIIADSAQLIEDEVGRKRGLRAMGLKAGYRAVKAVHPGVIEKALTKLLPEFAPAVDPHYAVARKTDDVEGYFVDHSAEIAEALLQVTDMRARQARNRVILKAYNGLRSQAKGHVREAMPGLARLIKKHVG